MTFSKNTPIIDRKAQNNTAQGLCRVATGIFRQFSPETAKGMTKMTFDEMFAQAKALLENASAKDTDTAVSVQFDVSGDGCGAFYAVVSADSDKLTIEPFDYKDHDVLVSADSAALLDALRTAETAALELAGEWEKIVAFRSVLDTLPKPKKEAAPKAKAPAAKKAAAKPAAKKAEAPKAAATVKKTEPVKPAAEKPAAATAKKETVKVEAPKAAAVKTEPVKPAVKTAATAAKAPAAKPAATTAKTTAAAKNSKKK